LNLAFRLYHRLLPPLLAQCLSHPFRDRHVLRMRNTLDIS
jgi:hypothetical protein